MKRQIIPKIIPVALLSALAAANEPAESIMDIWPDPPESITLPVYAECMESDEFAAWAHEHWRGIEQNSAGWGFLATGSRVLDDGLVTLWLNQTGGHVVTYQMTQRGTEYNCVLTTGDEWMDFQDRSGIE